MRFDVFHHCSRDEDKKLLQLISAKLDVLYREGKKSMAVLDALTAQVKVNTEVEASAVALLQTIAAKLAANSTDPVAVQALADQLKASADGLATVVAANATV